MTTTLTLVLPPEIAGPLAAAAARAGVSAEEFTLDHLRIMFPNDPPVPAAAEDPLLRFAGIWDGPAESVRERLHDSVGEYLDEKKREGRL